MTMNSVWVASLLLATLAMMPAAAHVLEFPNRIRLSGMEYLTVQRLYRGWAFMRVVVIAALMATLALLFLVRQLPTAFALAWVAFLCIAGTQLVFWTFTQPINRVTGNWTFLPGDWPELRRRWEYSHVACAVLNLAALVALVVCLFWANAAPRFDLDAQRQNDATGSLQRGEPQYDRGYEAARDARRGTANGNARYM